MKSSGTPLPPELFKELELNSDELRLTLNYVLKGKARSIISLRSEIWNRFYEVLDAMENDEAVMKAVFAFHENKRLSFSQVRGIRTFLREKFIGIMEKFDSEEDWSEYGNQSLLELWWKIRDLHTKSWFSENLIGEFVGRWSDFVDAFLLYYTEENADEAESSAGWVKTKTKNPSERGRRDGESWEIDEWLDDEDEKWRGLLNWGDIVTLRILFSCIDSFLSSLNRNTEDLWLEDALKNDKIVKIWGALNPLVQKLKSITHLTNIRRALETENEYKLNSDMLEITQKWDSYWIDMEK